MRRRRRSLSRRMLRLTALYGSGGMWSIYAAVPAMRHRHSYTGQMLRDRLSRRRPRPFTRPTRPT